MSSHHRTSVFSLISTGANSGAILLKRWMLIGPILRHVAVAAGETFAGDANSLSTLMRYQSIGIAGRLSGTKNA